jgi:quinol monooxygenase YgiN
MLHVIATIELKPGRREAFLAAFRELAPKVHAEAGCIEYGITEDVVTGLAAQGAARPDVLTIVERWTSLDHLRAHLAAPHMADYGKQVKDLRTGVHLQVLQPL